MAEKMVCFNTIKMVCFLLWFSAYSPHPHVPPSCGTAHSALLCLSQHNVSHWREVNGTCKGGATSQSMALRVTESGPVAGLAQNCLTD